jgi:hypothetical protein
MATRSLATDKSATGPSMGLREEDYRTFCAALESTQRGRDFLFEYARRNRNADTEMLLDSLDRIETMMKAEGKAHDRLRDELRVLLIAIRLARPDINSSTALTKAARLVDLLDLMEHRIDAMVENKDLPPIAEEPLPAPAAFTVVPRPDEPELPIPSVTATLPPPISLVQEPAKIVIKPLAPAQDAQEGKELAIEALAKLAIPTQDAPKQEAPQEALQVAPKVTPQVAPKAVLKPAPAKQDSSQQELAEHEWAQLEILNRPKTKSDTKAEPYELWEPEAVAPVVAAAAQPVAPPAAAPSPPPAAPPPAAAEQPAPEKWLPDFGDAPQIIHTKPVTAAAFMPEVTFVSAPARNAVAETKADTAVVEVAVTTVVMAAAESATAAAPAARAVPPRTDPLAAIMSLSEAERIALFT